MNKTPEELAVDVTNTFITAWFSKSSNGSLKCDDVQDLLKETYKTISNLSNNTND